MKMTTKYSARGSKPVDRAAHLAVRTLLGLGRTNPSTSLTRTLGPPRGTFSGARVTGAKGDIAHQQEPVDRNGADRVGRSKLAKLGA